MITAKMNSLNPRNYVHWLLEETPIVDNPGSPACLDSLMPWPESMPADIRPKPEAAEEAAKMIEGPIFDIGPSIIRGAEE